MKPLELIHVFDSPPAKSLEKPSDGKMKESEPETLELKKTESSNDTQPPVGSNGDGELDSTK